MVNWFLDFQMLNQACILEINPTCHDALSILCMSGFCLLIFCLEYLFIFHEWSLEWFWNHNYTSLIKCARKCSLFYSALEKFVFVWNTLFFTSCQNSPEKLLNWSVFSEELNYEFNFFNEYKTIQIFYFFWVSFLNYNLL